MERFGFGTCGGRQQRWTGVVHYWPHEGEEGFYLSSGHCDDVIRFTHWMPLPEDHIPLRELDTTSAANELQAAIPQVREAVEGIRAAKKVSRDLLDQVVSGGSQTTAPTRDHSRLVKIALEDVDEATGNGRPSISTERAWRLAEEVRCLTTELAESRALALEAQRRADAYKTAIAEMESRHERAIAAITASAAALQADRQALISGAVSRSSPGATRWWIGADRGYLTPEGGFASAEAALEVYRHSFKPKDLRAQPQTDTKP